MQWVHIRIILAGSEDAESIVHYLISLSEAGGASPAFHSLVVAREGPVDVENRVYTWMSQPGGPGRHVGGFLKGS